MNNLHENSHNARQHTHSEYTDQILFLFELVQ